MKISGFTIIRNATLLGFPAKESILSLLPLVDEMIVVIGESSDDTEEVIRDIKSDKIRIINSQLKYRILAFIEHKILGNGKTISGFKNYKLVK